MAKRIKRVFSNGDQVIHLWANQSQTDARCKNVYFEGNSVWSYGSHYELGRLMEFNGIKIAVINDSGYSVTTSGHINAAWHAVSHLTRIKVGTLTTRQVIDRHDIEDALIKTQGELVDTFFDIFNRRTLRHADYHLESNYGPMSEALEFNKTCTALGFKNLALDICDEYVQLVKDHSKLCIKRESELNSPEALAEKRAKNLKKASESIAKWRVGGPLSDTVRRLEPQLIRVNGNEVQTSKGASVPLDHALRLFKLVEAGRARSGERVGHFTLNHVQDDTVKIGCHNILLSEAKTVLSKVA